MKASIQTPSKRAKARAQQHRKQMLSAGSIVSGAILLVLAVIFLITNQKTAAQTVIPPAVGVPMSDFYLSNISGETVRLSDYRGKVVLVNAWATWCPPCRGEMASFNTYYQRHVNDGFVVLAVNAGESQEKAAAFASERQLAFPVLLDPQSNLLDDLHIDTYPTSIIIGRDGIVKEIYIGMLTSDQIEEKVTPLLSQ